MARRLTVECRNTHAAPGPGPDGCAPARNIPRAGRDHSNERVADFAILDEQTSGRAILGLRTAQGTFVRASWFIDASGGDASLLGSASTLNLSRMGRARLQYGRTCQLKNGLKERRST